MKDVSTELQWDYAAQEITYHCMERISVSSNREKNGPVWWQTDQFVNKNDPALAHVRSWSKQNVVRYGLLKILQMQQNSI